MADEKISPEPAPVESQPPFEGEPVDMIELATGDKVSLDELKKGYMRQADYTKKRQASEKRYQDMLASLQGTGQGSPAGRPQGPQPWQMAPPASPDGTSLFGRGWTGRAEPVVAPTMGYPNATPTGRLSSPYNDEGTDFVTEPDLRQVDQRIMALEGQISNLAQMTQAQQYQLKQDAQIRMMERTLPGFNTAAVEEAYYMMSDQERAFYDNNMTPVAKMRAIYYERVAPKQSQPTASQAPQEEPGPQPLREVTRGSAAPTRSAPKPLGREYTTQQAVEWDEHLFGTPDEQRRELQKPRT